MRPAAAALASCILASLCAAQNIIDLNGSGWTLTNSNGSISVPANVPSDQYLDLYSNGILQDPLYGFNDSTQSWVYLNDWTYTSNPITNLDKNSETWVIFEGLDTFAHVSLCGQAIGDTNNQFRQWLFDVTDVVQQCNDELRLSIDFGSPVKIMAALSNSTAGDPLINFGDSCNADSPLGCKAYARKEQNDFGWDWSPALAPSGPWRPIYAVQLTKSKPVYINNALVDIFRQGQMHNLPPDQSQPWVFNASLDFIGELPNGASLQLELEDAAGSTVVSTSLDEVYSSSNTITGSTAIDASNVQLWWPAGMGPQCLYNATVSIVDQSQNVFTQVQRRVGFRTIVLNQTPITDDQIALGIAPGSNWHFEINGHEFYAKGSNFVPPSPFWPSVNETKVRQLFELAVLGSQNMLRVWASGAYLDDWIYDIADEYGLLLWSEFQFSDAVYPNSTEYLQNYEAEAYYNVRRVNHHPSLALWAGGNELEEILLYLYFDPKNPNELQRKYEQVFLELLIKCVYANTRSISYIPSSTYNGYLSLDFNRTMPQIPRYANTSGPGYFYANSDYYNYDVTQAFNLSSYPVARFADEFGFHAMSSLQSWQAEAPSSDWYLESPTVLHHNRHYPFGQTGSPEKLSQEGMEEMIDGVELFYPKPDLGDSIANFTAWIYSTQVFQADFYRSQIAFYRRGSGRPERQLGSLYWMLEDLWAAPTWSSIDVLGRQKVVYYGAKDLYQPVIVNGYYNASTSNLQIWTTSDRWWPVSGTVTLEWMNFAGEALLMNSSSHKIGIDIGPINSTKVLEFENLNQTLAANGIDSSDVLIRTSVEAESQGSNQQSYNHVAYFHPTSLAEAPLKDPGLELKMVSVQKGTRPISFQVTATKAIAAWVWIDYTSTAIQGYWSDNGFWLAKGESKEVTFTIWNDWSGGTWTDTVTARSLWNNREH